MQRIMLCLGQLSITYKRNHDMHVATECSSAMMSQRKLTGRCHYLDHLMRYTKDPVLFITDVDNA